MIVGIFPKDIHVSWESHLFGVVVGLAVAFLEAFTGRKEEVIETSNISSTYTIGLDDYFQYIGYYDVNFTNEQKSQTDEEKSD